MEAFDVLVIHHIVRLQQWIYVKHLYIPSDKKPSQMGSGPMMLLTYQGQIFPRPLSHVVFSNWKIPLINKLASYPSIKEQDALMCLCL